LASSLLNAVYFFRVIERVYLHEPPSSEGTSVRQVTEPPARILFPILVLAAGILILGAINAVIVTQILELVVAPLY
jgi:multicomponent Na+:H+ antiporter subunit D